MSQTRGVYALSSVRAVRLPRPITALSILMVTALVLGVLTLAFVPWQQTAIGAGRLIAFAPLEREQPIEAPIDGRVERWLVAEGSRVEEGAPLVELSDNDPLLADRLDQEAEAAASGLEAARGATGALARRLEAVEDARGRSVEAARARVEGARTRLVAAEQAQLAAQAALTTAELHEARQRRLEAEGLASRRTLETAQLDLARGRAELERARAAVIAAQADLTASQADLARIDAEAQEKIESARASLESAREKEASEAAELLKVQTRVERQARQRITAPRSGTVLRLVAREGGEMVKAGDVLAVLVPDAGQAAVELWLSGNDAPLVSPGREVRLQFEGWPAVQFAGWPSVAVGTFGGEVALVDASAAADGRTRVVILPSEPWPASTHLRQGIRVNGWVLLEQVSLGYELWRRINGFPPTLRILDPAKDGASGKGGAA